MPAWRSANGPASAPSSCSNLARCSVRSRSAAGSSTPVSVNSSSVRWDAFGSAGRLAGVAGLAPVPRDSGRISGNMRRPHRYHRRLLRVFFLSAQIAARFCPTSQAFYNRKRAEGKSHKQAILARRRLDVLWALIRDQRTFEVLPPQRGLAVG